MLSRVAAVLVGALTTSVLVSGNVSAATSPEQAAPRARADGLALAQAPAPRPKAAPGKNCRREPIWGFRMSPFCKPTGICSDRVIKGYRTVCS